MITDGCGNTCGRECAKGSRKEAKLHHVCTEIQRMWDMQCVVVPILIGATGMVTRGLRENLEAIPRNNAIDSVHMTAVLGTSHIMWRVMQCETWSLIVGDHGSEVPGRKGLWQETTTTTRTSGVPRNFFRGKGGSTNSVEDRGQRGRGSEGGSPLVRGSGGSCNLVQEISFHIVKFS